MKRCPTCQQTYTDNAPDFCPNDGARMIMDAPQQQYAPGAGYPQPYSPPQPPQQNWPPSQPPPQNWSPGVAGYQPQAGHAPYAPRVAAGGGLGRVAMLCGLVSFVLTAFFFFIVVMVRNGNFDMVDFAQPSYYGMVLTGAAGLLLGIIALVKSGGGKGKAIIAICASLPALLFFAYVIATTGQII